MTSVVPPPVCASAPGKVILFGEHSVVYGQPAVAAALSDLRIQVRLSPNVDDGTKPGWIRLVMPDLPDAVDCSLPARYLSELKAQLLVPPTVGCARLLDDLVRSHATTQLTGRDVSDEHTIHAILPALYLISQLAPNVILQQGCTIEVKSLNLPVGAGLGSSAAFGVACAAALFQWKEPWADHSIQSSITPSSDLIQEINRYAYYSEVLLHGRPSGIDNTVSCQGGALLFTRSHHEVSLQPIHLERPLQLLLVYTHVPRQTKKLVAAVRTLYEQHPTIVTPILEAMGKIAVAFCDLVSPTHVAHLPSLSSTLSGSETLVSAMLTLVRTNQSLLTALGVSHPSLDRICAVVQQLCPDTAAAKLTGAGGGGCAMILLAPTATSNTSSLQRQLTAALQAAAQPEFKFDFLSSTVGGDGVLFVPPAEFMPQRQTKELYKESWWPALTVVAVGAAMTTLAIASCRGRKH